MVTPTTSTGGERMDREQRELELLRLFDTEIEQWQPSIGPDLGIFHYLCMSGKVTFDEIIRTSQGVIYIRPRCTTRADIEDD